MRLDGLQLNDDFVDRLLDAAGADEATRVDPAARRNAVGALALYALEQLVAPADDGSDEVAVRPGLEQLMTELAGRRRALALERDRAGVPTAFWTWRRAWQDLEAAPPGAAQVELLLEQLLDLFDLHPDLRVLISSRLLATDETAVGAIARELADAVDVVVSLGGARWRLRFDPASVLVWGLLAEDPERLPDERR